GAACAPTATAAPAAVSAKKSRLETVDMSDLSCSPGVLPSSGQALRWGCAVVHPLRSGKRGPVAPLSAYDGAPPPRALTHAEQAIAGGTTPLPLGAHRRCRVPALPRPGVGAAGAR